MKKIMRLTIFLLLITMVSKAQVKQHPHIQNIIILKGENWYGGAVNEGHKMPFLQGYSLILFGYNKGNQSAPLLLSS